MRDFKRDAVKIGLSLLAGFLLYFVLIGGVPFGLGFLTGRFTKAEVAAKADTIRIRDTIYLAAKQEAKKAHTQSERSHAETEKAKTLVAVVDAGQLALRNTPAAAPVVITVPVIVTDLIAKQATEIADLRVENGRLWDALFAADDDLVAHKSLIAAQKPDRCGRKCGIAIGVLGTLGSALALNEVRKVVR